MSTLLAALAAARFLSPPGVVNSSQNFAFLPISAEYLEAPNVSCSGCSWGQGGPFPYLFDVTAAPPANASCTPLGPPQPGTDRPGGDLESIVQKVDDASVCASSCCATAGCGAWAYASSAPAAFLSCAAGDHCCYLKSGQPDAKPLAGLTSGVVNRSAVTGAVAPPPGMRSAVPLGGLGAGALELRGDGTFQEVTIQNQSPAGAAKWGILADMALGVRAGADARLLRTSPPPFARGVSQLTYSGSYPLSRLAVGDASLAGGSAVVYAYSALVPGDAPASAAPAVSFTLTATNTGASPANFSWMLTVPLGAVNDCARPSKAPAGATTTGSYAACLAACAAAAAPACASWTWAAATGACALNADVPHTVYSRGAYCGVAGSWAADGRGLTLTAAPAGGAGGPANGDVSLRPVATAGGAPLALSFAAGDDPAALFADFAANGGFSGAQTFSGVAAAHGAAAVSAALAPGASVALTIVFSWFFPDRDHMGVSVGNFYANLWPSSAAVASELATEDRQRAVVADLNAHHAVFLDSSLPAFVADNAVNHMSHFRGFIWTADGRMREFEANDCPDVDSIHNDYQRHLPYLWLVPTFDLSKMRRWASGQAACGGCIYEYLGSFGLGPLDVPGGRIMGDTTTLFVVEVFEYWIGLGDESILEEFWPTVTAAVDWAIKQAGPDGLPTHLVCTYDILDLQQVRPAIGRAPRPSGGACARRTRRGPGLPATPFRLPPSPTARLSPASRALRSITTPRTTRFCTSPCSKPPCRWARTSATPPRWPPPRRRPPPPSPP
jgi:non-lysosomal glucosylceramidase